MKISLPEGCMGLTDRETTRVYADRARSDRSPRGIGSPTKRRSRSVEITNPAHLQAVKDNPYLNTPAVYLNGQGWDCVCGHGNWAWAQTCPKCGRERSACSG